MIHVQKIQQNTILKNGFPQLMSGYPFKKYNKIQSLRTVNTKAVWTHAFKKYNKIQSLRTLRVAVGRLICSKNTTKYNP